MFTHDWRGWAPAAALIVLGSLHAEAGVIAWASAQDRNLNLSAAISTEDDPGLANADRVKAFAGGDPWGASAGVFSPYSNSAPYPILVQTPPIYARATADGVSGVLRLRLQSDHYDGIDSIASGGAILTDTLRFLPGSTGMQLAPFLLELDLDYHSYVETELSTLRVAVTVERPDDPDRLNPVAGAGYMMRHFFDVEEDAARIIEFNCYGPCPPESVPGSLQRRIIFSQIFFAPVNVDLPLTMLMTGNVRGEALLDAESSAWLRIVALEGASYESLSGYSYEGRPGGPVSGEVPEPGSAGLAVAGVALLAALSRRSRAKGNAGA